jgi:hypothetical protein
MSDAITLNHAQTVARLKDIKDELQRLDARAADPEKGLTPEDETYWQTLVDESRSLVKLTVPGWTRS